MHGGEYLAHCADQIRNFLGATRQQVAFVPYALADHDGYESSARDVFEKLGHSLASVHHHRDPRVALKSADAIFVGGGNTFRLLATLHRSGLLHEIRSRVAEGMRYMGSSAGSNVAAPTIMTTNDMPIVMPPSFEALALVPFQINPHYLDPDPLSTHMGETREERLLQFHEENDTPVLAIREGCVLQILDKSMQLLGTTAARLFRQCQPPTEYSPPCDLSFLLDSDS